MSEQSTSSSSQAASGHGVNRPRGDRVPSGTRMSSYASCVRKFSLFACGALLGLTVTTVLPAHAADVGYSYDAAGRLVTVNTVVGTSLVTVRYQYDLDGNIVETVETIAFTPVPLSQSASRASDVSSTAKVTTSAGPAPEGQTLTH